MKNSILILVIALIVTGSYMFINRYDMQVRQERVFTVVTVLNKITGKVSVRSIHVSKSRKGTTTFHVAKNSSTTSSGLFEELDARANGENNTTKTKSLFDELWEEAQTESQSKKED